MCKATNVFLMVKLYIVFKIIKYASLPRLFSVVLYACYAKTIIYIFSVVSVSASRITFTKKNPTALH